MQLKRTDIDIDQAITLVQGLAQECEDLAFEFSGLSDGRGKYMDWAERCERQFRNLFADPEVVDGVYTDRYWRIAELGVIDRLAQISGSEIRFQADRLEHILATLHGYLQLRERRGQIVVPDTCVLLHFQRLDKIPWPLVIGAQPVRLVIPLLVLDELDDKRYLGSATIKEKARSAVKPLDEMQEQLDADGYATLPDGSTVEYLLDDPHHHRQANPDEEIVDRAAFLANVTKHPVIVLTGDRGMRVRVTARRDEGLRALVMPAQYSRDQDEVREASDGK